MSRGAPGPAVRAAVAAAVDAQVVGARALAGGDINDAWAVELDDGRSVFVKTNPDAPPGLFAREAHGLAWLRDADALRVPAVLAANPPDGPGPAFLALEMVTPGPRQPGFDAALGRGLAALHRAGIATGTGTGTAGTDTLQDAPADPAPDRAARHDAARPFGLDRDNYLATLPQDNTPGADWPSFYGERRLLPLVRRAVERGQAPRSWLDRLDALRARLPDLCGPPEPAARLHGDLWHGNVHTDSDGAPCLIDPAVYAGHREIDLAMLALFGGVCPALVAAYDEVWPLAPGRADRVPLYQLYPLLVHVALFGGSYVRSVQAVFDRYV